MTSRSKDNDPHADNPLPISAPERKPQPPTEGEPDLHLEEIEDKHIPKDRNIFDK